MSICTPFTTSQAVEFGWENRLLFAEHHPSNAASAFPPIALDEAPVLIEIRA